MARPNYPCISPMKSMCDGFIGEIKVLKGPEYLSFMGLLAQISILVFVTMTSVGEMCVCMCVCERERERKQMNTANPRFKQ